MLLFNAENISKSYGNKELFKNLTVSIFSGDRIGLIGQNGCGKSTFLKILAGLETADEGNIAVRKGLKVGYVPQSYEFSEKTPFEVLLEALKDVAEPDYEKERFARTWMSKLGFSGNEPVANKLSGGWQKRLLIAKEMVAAPDLLLIDEPTNHLDLEGILWLEKFLKLQAPTYLLVSHDRSFLQQSTSRVIEIDSAYPEGLFAIEGSYENFLAKKEEFLLGQLQQERSLSSKARREKQWLASNPKARTTKSQARIDQAEELLEDLAALKKRNTTRKAAVDFTASERDTRKLLVAKNISKALGDKTLFRNLDFALSPGTRIALMGPNGSGKTTLLRALAGEVTLDQGTLKTADALKIVYFDQHRNKLPLNLSLREALSPNGDFVTFRNQPVHINGWCKRFLFSPDTLDMPIGKLSGGERARIAIAHLMLQPADLLLLDEPTNDLDIPTLETFEESLLEFQGAVVLITHDRFMLTRLCNTFLALGDPSQTELFADYGQWEASLKKQSSEKEKPKEVKEEPKTRLKLSYMEKREFESLEETLKKEEKKLKELTHLLGLEEIALDPSRLDALCKEIGIIETHIERLYLRWEELYQKQNP